MNKIEKLIAAALFEGIAHATIIPVIIFNLTNYFVKGNWGGIIALAYIITVATIYLISKNKIISRFAFFSTITLVYGGWIAFFLVSAIFAGLGGNY